MLHREGIIRACSKKCIKKTQKKITQIKKQFVFLCLKLSTLNIMTYQHLAQLEHLLMHEASFEKTYSYFMDHFGVNPAFIDVGQKTSVPNIITMLVEITRQFFQKEEELLFDGTGVFATYNRFTSGKIGLRV